MGPGTRVAADARRFRLQPHPATPCDVVHSLHATLQRLDGQRWRVDFDLRAPIAQLRVPSPAATARRDGLWQHLCGEAFFAGAGPAYGEFNFSPSGEWAAYVFAGWRQLQAPADLPLAPQVRLLADAPDGLQWYAEFALPAVVAPAPTRVALCAVVETATGERSYWALAHGAPQPDFHREESFVPWVSP